MDQDKFKQYFAKDTTEALAHTCETPEEIAERKEYNQKAKIIRQQARIAFARSVTAPKSILTR